MSLYFIPTYSNNSNYILIDEKFESFQLNLYSSDLDCNCLTQAPQNQFILLQQTITEIPNNQENDNPFPTTEDNNNSNLSLPQPCSSSNFNFNSNSFQSINTYFDYFNSTNLPPQPNSNSISSNSLNSTLNPFVIQNNFVGYTQIPKIKGKHYLKFGLLTNDVLQSTLREEFNCENKKSDKPLEFLSTGRFWKVIFIVNSSYSDSQLEIVSNQNNKETYLKIPIERQVRPRSGANKKEYLLVDFINQNITILAPQSQTNQNNITNFVQHPNLIF
eukprot:TRINITY_DN852_c1_g2_i2.p1 TRINITY_DN852_c1_g2~~TRINITY_DN852_c1_g2_i2.p1  ORF type:complete len:274 (+),score=55.53 TRINITY_DN852_c1_g2_i2:48-869(+)